MTTLKPITYQNHVLFVVPKIQPIEIGKTYLTGDVLHSVESEEKKTRLMIRSDAVLCIIAQPIGSNIPNVPKYLEEEQQLFTEDDMRKALGEMVLRLREEGQVDLNTYCENGLKFSDEIINSLRPKRMIVGAEYVKEPVDTGIPISESEGCFTNETLKVQNLSTYTHPVHGKVIRLRIVYE